MKLYDLGITLIVIAAVAAAVALAAAGSITR
jgi:hypothetical protein